MNEVRPRLNHHGFGVKVQPATRASRFELRLTFVTDGTEWVLLSQIE